MFKFVLISWIVAILVAFRIGKSKGREADAVVLAVLLGWVGVIVISKMRESDRLRSDRETAAWRRRQAAASRQAAAATSNVTSASGLPARPALIAEALERDPSLADTSHPQAAERLAKAVAAVEADHRMQLGLSPARSLQGVNDSLADGDLATLATIQAEAGRLARLEASWHHCQCGHDFKATVNRICPRCGTAIA